jgi:LPXTG-site transpeptidase (sortase) family protein
MTTIRHSGQDRPPARRAVPALLSLGLLLCIAWLAVGIGRPDQTQPQPARPTGPMVIVIPSIGVKAGIVGVGLQADGAMQIPDPNHVGWYKRGPRPGQPGPAVLVGHVYYHPGPAVFYRLRELHRGDQILIRQRHGPTMRFTVQRLELVPKTALPTDRIWTKSSKPQLRLVTCGGDYDHTTRHYRDNQIVYAAWAGS